MSASGTRTSPVIASSPTPNPHAVQPFNPDEQQDDRTLSQKLIDLSDELVALKSELGRINQDQHQISLQIKVKDPEQDAQEASSSLPLQQQTSASSTGSRAVLQVQEPNAPEDQTGHAQQVPDQKDPEQKASVELTITANSKSDVIKAKISAVETKIRETLLEMDQLDSVLEAQSARLSKRFTFAITIKPEETRNGVETRPGRRIGATPLLVAVENFQPEVVAMILAEPKGQGIKQVAADVDQVCDYFGKTTAFLEAVKTGQLEIVRLLLPKSRMPAIAKGDAAVLAALFAEFKEDKQKATELVTLSGALLIAAINDGGPLIVKELMKYGLTISQEAVDLALIKYNSAELIEALFGDPEIDQRNAKLEAKQPAGAPETKAGQLPKERPVSEAHKTILTNALHAALKYFSQRLEGNVQKLTCLIEVLVKYGADVNENIPAPQEEKSVPPLVFILKRCGFDADSAAYKLVAALFNGKTKPKLDGKFALGNAETNTLLQSLVLGNNFNPNLIELFVINGANRAVCISEAKDTVLHLCFTIGSLEIMTEKVKALLLMGQPLSGEALDAEVASRKTFIDMQNSRGETALWLAAKADAFDAVKLLLDAGADPSLKPPDESAAIFYLISSQKASFDLIKKLCVRSDVDGRVMAEVLKRDELQQQPQVRQFLQELRAAKQRLIAEAKAAAPKAPESRVAATPKPIGSIPPAAVTANKTGDAKVGNLTAEVKKADTEAMWLAAEEYALLHATRNHWPDVIKDAVACGVNSQFAFGEAVIQKPIDKEMLQAFREDRRGSQSYSLDYIGHRYRYVNEPIRVPRPDLGQGSVQLILPLIAVMKNSENKEDLLNLMTDLLAGGADPLAVADRNNETALHTAVESGIVDAVPLLLSVVEDPKKLLDAKDSEGQTALLHAMTQKHVDMAMVQALVVPQGKYLPTSPSMLRSLREKPKYNVFNFPDGSIRIRATLKTSARAVVQQSGSQSEDAELKGAAAFSVQDYVIEAVISAEELRAHKNQDFSRVMADPNAEIGPYTTELYEIISTKGHQLILIPGANVEVANKDGYFPIFAAIDQLNADAFSLLNQAGANLRYYPQLFLRLIKVGFNEKWNNDVENRFTKIAMELVEETDFNQSVEEKENDSKEQVSKPMSLVQIFLQKIGRKDLKFAHDFLIKVLKKHKDLNKDNWLVVLKFYVAKCTHQQLAELLKNLNKLEILDEFMKRMVDVDEWSVDELSLRKEILKCRDELESQRLLFLFENFDKKPVADNGMGVVAVERGKPSQAAGGAPAERKDAPQPSRESKATRRLLEPARTRFYIRENKPGVTMDCKSLGLPEDHCFYLLITSERGADELRFFDPSSKEKELTSLMVTSIEPTQLQRAGFVAGNESVSVSTSKFAAGFSAISTGSTLTDQQLTVLKAMTKPHRVDIDVPNFDQMYYQQLYLPWLRTNADKYLNSLITEAVPQVTRFILTCDAPSFHRLNKDLLVDLLIVITTVNMVKPDENKANNDAVVKSLKKFIDWMSSERNVFANNPPEVLTKFILFMVKAGDRLAKVNAQADESLSSIWDAVNTRGLWHLLLLPCDEKGKSVLYHLVRSNRPDWIKGILRKFMPQLVKAAPATVLEALEFTDNYKAIPEGVRTYLGQLNIEKQTTTWLDIYYHLERAKLLLRIAPGEKNLDKAFQGIREKEIIFLKLLSFYVGNNVQQAQGAEEKDRVAPDIDNGNRKYKGDEWKVNVLKVIALFVKVDETSEFCKKLKALMVLRKPVMSAVPDVASTGLKATPPQSPALATPKSPAPAAATNAGATPKTDAKAAASGSSSNEGPAKGVVTVSAKDQDQDQEQEQQLLEQMASLCGDFMNYMRQCGKEAEILKGIARVRELDAVFEKDASLGKISLPSEARKTSAENQVQGAAGMTRPATQALIGLAANGGPGGTNPNITTPGLPLTERILRALIPPVGSVPLGPTIRL